MPEVGSARNTTRTLPRRLTRRHVLVEHTRRGPEGERGAGSGVRRAAPGGARSGEVAEKLPYVGESVG
jgi:hypothetical protein